MPRIAAGLDIATSSSAYGEGFSNTIGEAMASGFLCGHQRRRFGMIVGRNRNRGAEERSCGAGELVPVLDMGKAERKRLGKGQGSDPREL